MSVAVEGHVKEMSMVEAINSALDLALDRDPEVCLIGEDIADPLGGVVRATKGLSTKYGEHRVRATPIAEQAIVGAAVGAALAGMRPVAEIMLMDFIAVCMDQIANHAARLRFMSGGRTGVPLTIRAMVGNKMGSQHSTSLEGWLMHTPGLKVAVPGTPADAKGLLTTCIFDDDPCIFVESMAMAFAPRSPVPTGHHAVPLGSAEVKREGEDVTLITYGRLVGPALAAAEECAQEDIGVEVVDLRWLVPLDVEAVLSSVARTRRAVVAHTATKFAGPGAEIAGLITEHLFDELEKPVKRVGAPYSPVPSGATEEHHSPQVSDLRAAIREVMAN